MTAEDHLVNLMPSGAGADLTSGPFESLLLHQAVCAHTKCWALLIARSKMYLQKQQFLSRFRVGWDGRWSYTRSFVKRRKQ
ncbi:hypothetical protein ACLOJK_032456 [Asimina triloba]